MKPTTQLITVLVLVGVCMGAFPKFYLSFVEVQGDTVTNKEMFRSAGNGNHSLAKFFSDYELLYAVHTADRAAILAGEWVFRPYQSIRYSKEHLQCLDLERQGNCHDPDAWKKSEDKAKKTRHDSILKNAISNSAGILNASDPWVWTSNWTAYQVIPYDQFYHTRIRSILANRTVYLIGDSLTRQWAQILRCECMHILGFSEQQTEQTIQFISDHVGAKMSEIETTMKSARPSDYVVINYGHHVGNKLGPGWQRNYSSILQKLQDLDFGPIPDQQIFFRTTSVRHFLRGAGDWNTNSSSAGGAQPNMDARWSMYGGNDPELPTQNKIALRVFASEKRRRSFQILDTSPMMLARADATFDGSHFCLPGPHQFWSQMLYFRMEQNSNAKS